MLGHEGACAVWLCVTAEIVVWRVWITLLRQEPPHACQDTLGQRELLALYGHAQLGRSLPLRPPQGVVRRNHDDAHLELSVSMLRTVRRLARPGGATPLR